MPTKSKHKKQYNLNKNKNQITKGVKFYKKRILDSLKTNVKTELFPINIYSIDKYLKHHSFILR